MEFIDTNVLVYAHDGGAGEKHSTSELLRRLFETGDRALNTQVLCEFYAVATKKLAMKDTEAEAVIEDLGGWTIHRPGHGDLLEAARLRRRHKLAWCGALIVNSAIQLGCAILWSEDLNDGQRYGTTTVRNPFG